MFEVGNWRGSDAIAALGNENWKLGIGNTCCAFGAATCNDFWLGAHKERGCPVAGG